jgi:hypothetical protein
MIDGRGPAEKKESPGLRTGHDTAMSAGTRGPGEQGNKDVMQRTRSTLHFTRPRAPVKRAPPLIATDFAADRRVAPVVSGVPAVGNMPNRTLARVTPLG